MPRLTNEQREYNVKDRPIEKLRMDLVVAFDRIHEQGLKIWILMGVVVAEGVVIKLLFSELLHRLH